MIGKTRKDEVMGSIKGKHGRLGILATVLISFALASCSILPTPKAAPQLHTLSPKSTYKKSMPVVNWQLAVDLPIAPSGLNAPRIAVVRSPLTIDYFAGAQWIDNAPAMVQRLLIESFENSQKIIGVGRLTVSLRADYILRTELREFQAEYYETGKGPPNIFVRVNAKLVKMPQRKIIASATFDRKLPSPNNTKTGIIKTFDRALGKVMRDIVVWTINTPSRSGG